MLERLHNITSCAQVVRRLASGWTAQSLDSLHAPEKETSEVKKCGEISPSTFRQPASTEEEAKRRISNPRAITAQNVAGRAQMKGHLGWKPGASQSRQFPSSGAMYSVYSRVSTRMETDAGGKVLCRVP